jgi:hypothetical protein
MENIQASLKHEFSAMDWKWFVIHGTQAAYQRHVNSSDTIMKESSVGATQKARHPYLYSSPFTSNHYQKA